MAPSKTYTRSSSRTFRKSFISSFVVGRSLFVVRCSSLLINRVPPPQTTNNEPRTTNHEQIKKISPNSETFKIKIKLGCLAVYLTWSQVALTHHELLNAIMCFW